MRKQDKPPLRIYSLSNAEVFLYVREFLPRYFELLDPDQNDLSTIERVFDSRLEYYKSQLSVSDSFYVENCLVDLIWRAKDHDLHAVRYLSFIEKQCAVILRCVRKNLWHRFKDPLMKMFINHDDAQSRMKSYVGEICVVARIISQGETQLVAVEEALPNGKHLDYKFETEGKSHFVEIHNIDLYSDRLTSSEDVTTFLERRAIRKLREKLEGVPKPMRPVSLAQVVWGRIFDLDRFLRAFKQQNNYKGLYLPVYVVAELTNIRTGGPEYFFLPVDKFLEKVIEGRHIAGG